MGFFKDMAFEASEKWKIARYYYGDDIARELYYLPNSEPLSLMTEKEKAALNLMGVISKAESFDYKGLSSVSENVKQERRDAYSDAKEALGPDFAPVNQPRGGFKNNEYVKLVSERAARMWRHRLELFKENGSVE